MSERSILSAFQIQSKVIIHLKTNKDTQYRVPFCFILMYPTCC
nr:MAG TPA: hypothetical protein [Caudoviricetes sp.]